MKDINLDSSTEVNPLGQEIYLHGSSADAVLIIHGFTGAPFEMEYLGRSIYKTQGRSVYIPRLPGHGTNSSDFRRTIARDWIRRAYDCYLNMQAKYNNVSLIGTSMGGLLALLTAARFGIDKLVLISPALYVKNPLVPLAFLIKYFLPCIKNKNSERPEGKYEKIHYENYKRVNYTAQVAELYKIMRLARKKLSAVTASTLILSSRADRTVPLKAATKIENEISSPEIKKIIYENSPHVINDGPDRESCAEKIIEFLGQ